MIEILEGFSQRMEFIAIVDSITNRRNTTEKIESLFSENKMENLILSALVYIMETTLTEEEECTIENITIFIKSIISQYTNKTVDVKELTRYIIKDILQNKGQNRYYEIVNYTNNSTNKLPIRLIADKLNDEEKVVYELTKQGYNFLFRTKEVDDELGFKIEEVKLKMLIHKKNYKKAVSTSRELIRMLKNKKIELNQFEDSLRNNINNITGEMYDNLVNKMYKLLEEEYEEMEQIGTLINESLDRIKQEEKMVENLDEKTKNAKREIYNISKNIRTALNMQIELLTQCKKTKKLYMETLKETMEYSMVKTYNFKEEILEKLEKSKFENIIDIYAKLLRPIFMPKLEKSLNINTIYDKQTKIDKEEEEEYSVKEDILAERQAIEERIKRRNETHIAVIRTLLEFAIENKEGFDFKQYFNSIENETLKNNMVEEKLIFMQMLKLYDLKEIDIEEWKKEEKQNILESNGEFDLSYCLRNISYDKPDFYGINKLTIEKIDENIEFEIEKQETVEKIEMTNFRFQIQ